MADLNSLAIFAKVVEAEGFSEAARRLKIPISTVSRRVAELEDQLRVRLLERSTRNLRLTDVGAEVLEHAQRSAELSEAVDSLVSNQLSTVAGVLRLSAPPSISDTLLAPLLGAFQASHPNLRIQVLVTDRFVDLIAEGIDLAFRFGALRDSSLVARKILTYRHQLVASPAYLERVQAPRSPRDLLDHKLLAFSYWRPDNSWTFRHQHEKDQETLSFEPYLFDERLQRARSRFSGRCQHRRSTAGGATSADQRWAARRSHARMALSRIRLIGRAFEQPPHLASGPVF